MPLTTEQRGTSSTEDAATYDVYIEIDCDCEELLDAIGLEYKECEDDDTQNEVCISLDQDEFEDSLGFMWLKDANEQTIATTLLNPELGEYTTKVTVYKPNGDKLIFK